MPPNTFKKSDKIEISDIASKFKDLSKEEKIELVSYFLEELKRQHNVREHEIIRRGASIPIGIFANELSSLEAIVKYMKEELKLKFSKTARLLNRSNKTIWATYRKAARKIPSPFGEVSHDIMIPVSAFAERKFSTLESVVAFIKDLDYSNHEVALMLHLDDRTIWTVYDRIKQKRGMKVDRA